MSRITYKRENHKKADVFFFFFSLTFKGKLVSGSLI